MKPLAAGAGAFSTSFWLPSIAVAARAQRTPYGGRGSGEAGGGGGGGKTRGEEEGATRNYYS